MIVRGDRGFSSGARKPRSGQATAPDRGVA